MSIPFINHFEVPTGDDGQFLALWQRVNSYMAATPGYRPHRLHRALSDGAHNRYIDYAEWESIEQWQSAHDAGFRIRVGDPAWAKFPSTPTLCEVVHGGRGLSWA
jgi:heme-degrading monooxygenase HmoA